MKEERLKERMIHIRLPDDVHRKLRILTAELDTTIQNWMKGIIMKELKMQKRAKG
jgi:hypothetical protein